MKVPKHCPLVLIVKVGSRRKGFGSRERNTRGEREDAELGPNAHNRRQSSNSNLGRAEFGEKLSLTWQELL
jgi:hypothetical protein